MAVGSSLAQHTSLLMLPIIGGGKGGAKGLQPHLILRVLYSFTIEIFSCLSISPIWFDYLPPPMLPIGSTDPVTVVHLHGLTGS